MRSLEIGLVLPMGEVVCRRFDPRTGRRSASSPSAPRSRLRHRIWVPDELLWRPPDGEAQGWWECVAMTGAVASATSRIKVGTWVLSALHRNPGITTKAVETLDEISGGRFVLGLGSGPCRPPGPRLRPARGPRVRAIRGGGPDHCPAPAARSRGLRGDLPCGPGPRAPARRSSARPHPDHDGRQGSEDAPAGGAPRRHLELVRGGAQRPDRVRSAAGRDARGMRRGRARPLEDRSLGGDRGRADAWSRAPSPIVLGCAGPRDGRGDCRRHPRPSREAGYTQVETAPVAARARCARGDGAGRRAPGRRLSRDHTSGTPAVPRPSGGRSRGAPGGLWARTNNKPSGLVLAYSGDDRGPDRSGLGGSPRTWSGLRQCLNHRAPALPLRPRRLMTSVADSLPLTQVPDVRGPGSRLAACAAAAVTRISPAVSRFPARRAAVLTVSPSAVISVCISSPTAPTQARPVCTPAPTATQGPPGVGVARCAQQRHSSLHCLLRMSGSGHDEGRRTPRPRRRRTCRHRRRARTQRQMQSRRSGREEW